MKHGTGKKETMMVKESTMMNWSLSKLKKELWKRFSIFIRMRDKGICFSCGKKIPDYYDRHGNLKEGWKAAQAGHFITAKNCGLALYFNEKNVHCQCYHCNINLSGNWLEYERALIKKYGQEECDSLKRMKWQEEIKFSKIDYIEKIKDYENKISMLSEERSLQC